MTVSLPATLPATPAATKVGSAAGKAAGAAHGKPETAGADHQDVSDMFAALVAAVTQQMQPVAAQPSGEAVAGTPEGTVAGGELLAVLATTGDATAAPAVPTVPVAPATAIATDGETAIPVPVAAAVVEATVTPTAPTVETTSEDGVDVPVAPPATGAETGTEDGQDAASDQDGAAHVAVKRPAWAGSDARDVRPTPASGTTPATPAQPVQGSGPATPAVAATPAAKPDTETRPVNGLGVTAPPTPATPAAKVDAPAAVAAPPAPPADPHLQIARVVRPLRLGDDGAYELALDLTPAELGRVRIDVELRGSTINLHLRADNPATRELLQASLAQLRSELEAAGLQAGSLDIGGRGDSDRPTHDSDHVPTSTAMSDDPVVADPRNRGTTTVTDTSDGVNVLA